MERFPTWHVWKLLHRYPSPEMYEMLVRVQRVKYPASGRAQLSHVWIWVVMNVLLNIIVLLLTGILFNPMSGVITGVSVVLSKANFILPLFITFISLRYAIQVADAIAKQRELGSYDLFALPIGEATSIFNIARAYRHPLQGVIQGGWSGLVVLVLIFGYMVWLAVGSSYAMSVSLNELAGLVFLMMVTNGMMAFVDYLQSFVGAFLLAVLTSERENRADSQIWLVGYFLALQLALYVGVNVLTNLLGLPLLFDFHFQRFFLLWVVLLQPIIFILCRELVNFALWQAVKRRLEV